MRSSRIVVAGNPKHLGIASTNTGKREPIILVLKNITLQNGNASGSGFEAGSAEIVKDSTGKYIHRKTTILETAGGAVYVGQFGRLELYGVKFLNNYSPRSGGAVYFSGNSNLPDSILKHKGEIGSRVFVKDCTFSGNVSQGGGGAMYVRGVNEFNVSNSTFDGNESKCTTDACLIFEEGAGAIREQSGPIVIKDSVFTRNKGNMGGAIGLNGVMFDISNTKFDGNISKPGTLLIKEQKVYSEIEKKTITTASRDSAGKVIPMIFTKFDATNPQYKNPWSNPVNKPRNFGTGSRGGGAIYADVSEYAGINVVHKITSCEFTNNQGVNDGGAIYMFIRKSRLFVDGTPSKPTVFEKNSVDGRNFINIYRDSKTNQILEKPSREYKARDLSVYGDVTINNTIFKGPLITPVNTTAPYGDLLFIQAKPTTIGNNVTINSRKVRVANLKTLPPLPKSTKYTQIWLNGNAVKVPMSDKYLLMDK